MGGLKHGFVNNGRVFWGANPSGCGQTDRLHNKIYIRYTAPQSREIWHTLAETGSFPYGVQALWHEEVHMAQSLAQNIPSSYWRLSSAGVKRGSSLQNGKYATGNKRD